MAEDGAPKRKPGESLEDFNLRETAYDRKQAQKRKADSNPLPANQNAPKGSPKQEVLRTTVQNDPLGPAGGTFVRTVMQKAPVLAEQGDLASAARAESDKRKRAEEQAEQGRKSELSGSGSRFPGESKEDWQARLAEKHANDSRLDSQKLALK